MRCAAAQAAGAERMCDCLVRNEKDTRIIALLGRLSRLFHATMRPGRLPGAFWQWDCIKLLCGGVQQGLAVGVKMLLMAPTCGAPQQGIACRSVHQPPRKRAGCMAVKNFDCVHRQFPESTTIPRMCRMAIPSLATRGSSFKISGRQVVTRAWFPDGHLES